MENKKSKYVINGEEFSTLNELRLRIRAIRDTYPDNVYINPNDLAFMCDVLKRHESADFKAGCGVVAMYVKTVPLYRNNRCFWLVRKDGSETDFSFEMCLRNKPESRLIKFKRACRSAISEEMYMFKNVFFSNKTKFCAECPFTGEVITPSQSHVDHAPPWTFEKIVSAFIRNYSINVDTVKIRGIREDKMLRNEIDDDLKQQFIDYHNERAKLRVISKKANLSIVKKIK